MSLLLLLGGAPAPALTDLWSGIREGDYLQLFSPYTAPGGETVLVRVLSRSYADGDAHAKLTLQFIDPIDASTRLSLLGELGTMAAPPPPANTETDQTAIVTEAANQVRELKMRVDAVEDANTRGDLSFSGAALYVNSTGNIIARRPDGTEATVI